MSVPASADQQSSQTMIAATSFSGIERMLRRAAAMREERVGAAEPGGER